MSIHKTSRELGVLCVAIFIIAAFLAIFSLTSSRYSANSVDETSAVDDVLFIERDILLSLVNEETGVRGYVATGDPKFLSIYHFGINNFSHDKLDLQDKLDNLQKVNDDISHMNPYEDAVQQYFIKQIHFVSSNNRNKAIANLLEGKKLFDKFRFNENLVEAVHFSEISDKRLGLDSFTRVSFLVSLGSILIIFSIGIRIYILLLRGAGIEIAAYSDSLTGLPNRRDFMRNLDKRIAQIENGERFYVGLIDLNDFKKINDTYGHDAGDKVLQAVGNRLKDDLSKYGDYVARLGGDEFAFISVKFEISDVKEALSLRLEKSINFSIPIGNDSVLISGSFGMISYPEDGNLSTDLIRRADELMYAAKFARSS